MLGDVDNGSGPDVIITQGDRTGRTVGPAGGTDFRFLVVTLSNVISQPRSGR